MSAAPSDVETVPPVTEASAPELGYHVRLDAFSGPMDLLLYLVRRSQVDIADIPIALIADQFIATVAGWTSVDLDVAGDFVLMAATLLEIKSRMVAPPADAEEAEGDDDGEGDLFDPRADLIRQLLAYRSFKDAVTVLSGLETERAQRLSRTLRESIPEDPDEVDGLSLANADPYLLYAAWEVVAVRLAGMGPRTVVYDDIPMEERMSAVTTALQATGAGRLGDLLRAQPHPVQQAGVLIAVLECTRQRLLELTQHEQYGEVHLRFRDQAERARELVPPPEEPVAEGRRRRRRAPLVTWHAADAAAVPADESGDDTPAAEAEEVVESEEARFLREMNAACALEAVLARSVDLEAGFAAFLAERAAAAAEPVASSPDLPGEPERASPLRSPAQV